VWCPVERRTGTACTSLQAAGWCGVLLNVELALTVTIYANALS